MLVHSPTAEPSFPYTLLFSVVLSWAGSSPCCKFLVDTGTCALLGPQAMVTRDFQCHIDGTALLG